MLRPPRSAPPAVKLKPRRIIGAGRRTTSRSSGARRFGWMASTPAEQLGNTIVHARRVLFRAAMMRRKDRCSRANRGLRQAGSATAHKQRDREQHPSILAAHTPSQAAILIGSKARAGRTRWVRVGDAAIERCRTLSKLSRLPTRLSSRTDRTFTVIGLAAERARPQLATASGYDNICSATAL